MQPVRMQGGCVCMQSMCSHQGANAHMFESHASHVAYARAIRRASPQGAIRPSVPLVTYTYCARVGASLW